MKCITCQKLDLRADFPMARLGFGKCAMDEGKSHSVSYRFERECSEFSEVSDEVKVTRITWADGILKAREMRR